MYAAPSSAVRGFRTRNDANPDLDAACDVVELTLQRLEARGDRRSELVLGLESLAEANR